MNKGCIMRDKMISELELKVDNIEEIDFEVISERYRKLSEKVDKRLKEIRSRNRKK